MHPHTLTYVDSTDTGTCFRKVRPGAMLRDFLLVYRVWFGSPQNITYVAAVC
jgi:hypothetical protein